MTFAGSDPRRALAPGLFDGRTAVVTGGGRGIGKAIAVGFAELGADVVVASNEPAELAEVGERSAPSVGDAWRSTSTSATSVPSSISATSRSSGSARSTTSSTTPAGSSPPRPSPSPTTAGDR
jgi:NAD(P)-dependent dehydrogenase (short-subunit alcohol dehydrogenase family)